MSVLRPRKGYSVTVSQCGADDGRAGDGKSKTNNAIKPGDRVKTGALCHKNLGEILQTC